jgi:hypothetical protein
MKKPTKGSSFIDYVLCPHNCEIPLKCEKCERGEEPCAAYLYNIERGIEIVGSREANVLAYRSGRGGHRRSEA